jgi:dihydrolipoamide dehydrogenase
VAGIRAGQLGLKAAVVEKDAKLGGTCTLRGCIPTKALLHTAAVLEEIRGAGGLGIAVGDPELDLPKAQQRKQKVVDSNSGGVEFLLKKNKVDRIHGFGRVKGRGEEGIEIEVEDADGAKTVHRAKNLILATGSVPREIPIARSDGERILTSDHILELDRVPARLAVLGAGAVGTEFASIFRSFGSEVTLIEMLPRLLPLEDEEVSAELAKAFRRRGITSWTDTKLTGAEPDGDGLKLAFEGRDEPLAVDMLLVAVGRRPLTEEIGLEELGVKIERGYIEVDETMRTGVEGVYAIGDAVTQGPWLAHKASAEGILAVEAIAGEEVRPLDYSRIPSVVFTDPEVGSVGLTEAAAKEQGYEVQVGKFPFTASGKAKIEGKTAGFVKVVRETQYDEVLGIHIVGPHATDLIAEACVALSLEATAESLFRTVHAHPTLPEAIAEAAHASHGAAIHF